MTAPTHAQQIPGQGRWYIHPTTGEKWPSITNVLDVSVSKPALKPWAVKITADKAIDTIPAYIAAMTRPVCKPKRVADECGTCRTCLYKAIKRQANFVSDTASDLGTRIHAVAEAKVLGKPYADDPEVEPYVAQLLRFFHEHGVDVEKDIVATEATVINRKHGYAGTGDLWLNLRTGASRKRLVLVDYKSSATKPALTAYPEQGQQLAALANGESILLDNGDELDAPGPVKAAFVLALRADDYALIPMPMDGDLPAAFKAFLGALANARWHHSQHGLKPTAALPAQPTRKAS